MVNLRTSAVPFLLSLVLGASTASAQENKTASTTFNGLLQTWHVGGSGIDETFRIRRAELKFTGGISPKVKLTLMVDLAKALSTARSTSPMPDDNRNAGILVQDLFVTLNYHRRLNLNVGQFKIPLSLEGLESSAALDTERALFSVDRSRGGAYGDIREVGVMAFGQVLEGLDYQVGFFDGSGDVPDNGPDDDAKAMGARVVYRPAQVSGLQVGASRVWGRATSLSRAARHRAGVELRYVKGPLTLQTEHMSGNDGLVERAGYYAHAAYRFTRRWEAILRYDTWDPDIHLEAAHVNVTERDYIAGFNYLIDARYVNLQFNYVRKTFEDGIVSPSNIGATRLQIAW